jgi:glycosyltransferase involved in cell wall biosynthesis
MKIVHVSTLDLGGGAARGAYWLHQALMLAGAHSRMFVAVSNSGSSEVLESTSGARLCRLREVLDREALAAFPRRHQVYFSPATFSGSSLVDEINALEADVINLHWIAGGFLTPEEIAGLQKPLVWTLRDMWPFNGGCHYSEGCRRYEHSCGQCPVLASADPDDLTRTLWRRKARVWKTRPFQLVAVSRWMADCARRSSLFRGRPVEVIPNGVSTETFAPRDKLAARKALGLPASTPMILFGALYSTSDKRKGFHLLKPALELLKKSQTGPFGVLVFGATESNVVFEGNPPVCYLGTISDDQKLSEIYSAADVTVVPSLEDACPKVPMESMACGTPVVCFDATGLRDIVDHQSNGYRARCPDPADLAAGIQWVLDRARWKELSGRAIFKARQEFALKAQAARYLALYERMLQPASVNDIT